MQVKDLKPAGYNPRKISKEKLAALKKSLEEFGDLSGIVYNSRTRTLIGGHQRIKNLAAVMYLPSGDWRHVIYWLAAAVLTFTVTY
jgi:hypothetical protein